MSLRHQWTATVYYENNVQATISVLADDVHQAMLYVGRCPGVIRILTIEENGTVFDFEDLRNQ